MEMEITTTTQQEDQQVAPAPAPARYCGVVDGYEQMEDDEPPSPMSPSQLSSPLPLPLPEKKVSAAYRARLRRKNARINNGYRFRRPGERRKKKKNKSNHYTPPPPPSPQPRPPSPPPSSPQYEISPTLEPEDPDWMRQSMMYAESALEHYNADPGNDVKYELVRTIISGAIFTCKALYGHVNFIARASGSSQEQLFFAEVRKDAKGWMAACLRSLDDEVDRVGGLAAIPPAKRPDITSPSRRNYCFSCSEEIKHPKDGASYHAGH